MSRLYSSPEVIAVQTCRYSHPIRHALSGAQNRDVFQIRFDFASHRVQQRRVPHPPALAANGPNHQACQDKPNQHKPSSLP
jgi:hypothetical protein